MLSREKISRGKNQPPILIAAYLTECPGPEATRSANLAEVGRLIANALSS